MEYTYSRGRMNSTTIPSPPSPAASSPSLTQSASNSSSSPPQPTTPPRQPRPRYPDLGRVPLHRRGTSKTYERLEDLLREAGYKETRIFTPESDKHGVGQHDDDCSQSDYSNNKKPRQGVGAAVVGFLTGLVTGGGNMNAANGPSGSGESRQEDLGQQPSDNNPDRRPRLFSQTLTQSPTSPLADKYSSTTTYSRTNRNGSQSAESSEPQTPFMTSSIESLNDSTPKAYRRQTSYTVAGAQTYSRSPSRPTTPSYQNTTNQYHAPLSTTWYNHQQQQPPPPQSRHHRLSAAQLQLQHQASWSSINTLTSNNAGLASAPSSGAAANNMVSQTHLHGDQGTLISGSGVVPAYGGSDINHNNHVIHNPQPSRAGTYLRQMVSTPSIPHPPPPRPNSTPARHRIFSSSKTEESSDVEPTTNGQQQPPLPRNWLDNVARAILFGVAITPRSSSTTLPPQPQPPHHHQQRTLRTTRSSLSQTTIARTSKTTCRSGLSDQTNTIPPSSQFLTPPALSTRLERGRAPCSQGVLKAQVVCRSAPGSRASSLSRQHGTSGAFIRDRSSRNGETGRRRKHHQHPGGVGGGNDHKTRDRGRKKDKKTKKKKNKKKSSLNDDDEPTRVPSLSRTRIEGDGWQIHSHTHTHAHTSLPGIRPCPPNAHQHRLVSLSRSDTFSSSHSSLAFSDFNNSDANSTLSDYDYDNSDDSDSDSDDEGELNLARMLIPPKRQQSIRSLRKHLHLTSPSSTDISTSSSTSTITPATTTTANGNAKLNPSSSRLHTSSSHSALRPRIVSGAQSRLGSMREVYGRGRASGSEGTGEWEHEWRRGDYSSRRASEDDEEVESLTWLNRDRGGNGSQRSTAKSRLSLPVPWNTNT